MDFNSVNKVILVGYLGDDPEVKYTPNKNILSKLRIAQKRVGKTKMVNIKIAPLGII